MKSTMFKTLTSVACLLSTAFANPPEDTDNKQLIVHPRLSPATPYNYVQARTHAFITYPKKFAPLFEGAFGTPGGLNPQLGALIQGLKTNEIEQPNPAFVPHAEQLISYLRQHGGTHKSEIITQLEDDIHNGQLSPLGLVIAMFKGLADDDKISAKTKELSDHTIIRRQHKMFLIGDPKNRYWLAEADEKTKDDDVNNATGIVSYFVGCDAREKLEKEQNAQIKGIPYYGGKFGFVTHPEALCNRLSILALSPEEYEAHGCRFDKYSGLVHDLAHLDVMESFDKALEAATVATVDHHIVNGGTIDSYRTSGAPTVLAAEQQRFLNMMARINAEAFRVWGGTPLYDVFAVGQFLLTHEYPTVSGEMILNPSFTDTLKFFVKEHNRQLKQSEMWESPHDPLKTDPLTGRTALSDEDLKEKMFQKYKKDLLNKTDHLKTKGMDKKSQEIWVLENKISEAKTALENLTPESKEKAEKKLRDKQEALERGINLKLEENEIQDRRKDVEQAELDLSKFTVEAMDAQRLHLKALEEALKKANAEYDALVKKTLKMDLVQRAGGFIDLDVTLTNGKKIRFSETTLRHKAGNYADTRSLMKAAGIVLPKITNVASRTAVQDALRQGIDAWTKVMNRYLELSTHLAKTVVDATTGNTLEEDFFKARFQKLDTLKKALKEKRNGDDAVAYDYRSDETKAWMAGW